MGVAGSAMRGAAIGAGIGSFAGPVGTAVGGAVGAVVGEGAEVTKLAINTKKEIADISKDIAETNTHQRALSDNLNKQLISQVDNMSSSDDKIAELNRALEAKKTLRQAYMTDLETAKKAKYGWYNPVSWFGGNTATNTAAEQAQKGIDQLNEQIAGLEVKTKTLQEQKVTVAKSEEAKAIMTSRIPDADTVKAKLFEKRGKIEGQNMGKLEHLNANQVSILIQIRDGISALVSNIQSTPSFGGDYPDISNETIPRHGMTESPTFVSTLSQHPVVGLQT
jgi:hypothetical protein